MLFLGFTIHLNNMLNTQIEQERSFLLSRDFLAELPKYYPNARTQFILQTYLFVRPKFEVRVRTYFHELHNNEFTIKIKSSTFSTKRREINFKIPTFLAYKLHRLFSDHQISKYRWILPKEAYQSACPNITECIIDYYRAVPRETEIKYPVQLQELKNNGRCEIEFVGSLGKLPDFVGTEITGVKEYSNYAMANIF